MIELWNDVLNGSWAHPIALSLAHFLWQGTLIGLVALILSRWLDKASASSRYALHVIAFVSLPLCFALTLTFVGIGERTQTTAVSEAMNAGHAKPIRVEGSDSYSTHTTNDQVPSENLSADPGQTAETVDSLATSGSRATGGAAVDRTLRPSLAPFVVIFYFLGVAVLLLRLTLAVWGGQRLRTASYNIVDPTWLKIVADQARRVGLRIVPVVAIGERVAVPTVIGVLRPMVLLPAALTTGLTADEFAAVIRHELVHIRRYDLLVNLVQRLIESLLFFHPVVWFLSRQISRERELCCDDWVVASGFMPLDYAGTLLRMAELCAAANPGGVTTMAVTGNNPSEFEARLGRLMTMTGETPVRLTRSGGFLLGLLLLTLVFLPPLIVRVARAQEAPATDSSSSALQVQMEVLTANTEQKANGANVHLQVRKTEQSDFADSEVAFQTAYDSDPSFGRSSIKHRGQLEAIHNWNLALQQEGLTRQQQIFAWWRIGSLAAYNFRPDKGEAANNDLAADAFRQVLAIGKDLICRETLNAATVYATLDGGTRVDQANRAEFANHWLSTRTEAMVQQSALEINHNGYGIEDSFMPGGGNLRTEAEKQTFLSQQLSEARERLAARMATSVLQEDKQDPSVAEVGGVAKRLVEAAGSEHWKIQIAEEQPTVRMLDREGFRIVLHRSWKQYTSPPQQREANSEGPFETMKEDWEFVLFPIPSKMQGPQQDVDLESAAKRISASKIPWKAASSPYHIQAVCMGEGSGFLWYCKGTLFGQESVREILKLTGGDDRIELLITGIQTEDQGSITSNSCQQLRTTRLYDRRNRNVARNIVERISV